MARDLAIDLGTANTLVWTRGRGIVLNEPTVIAINQRTSEVLAMGHQAYSMIGRTPGHIVAERPLRGGAITDFDTTARLIKLVLQRVGVRRAAAQRRQRRAHVAVGHQPADRAQDGVTGKNRPFAVARRRPVGSSSSRPSRSR